MFALLMTPAAQAAGQACRGADPAITDATIAAPSSGDMSTYTVKVTIGNVGSSDQRKDVLQSVNIILDGEKKDQKGVPPLAAGASYTFSYNVHRAVDAGNGTTKVVLRLVMEQPAGDPSQNCSAANDSQRVVF